MYGANSPAPCIPARDESRIREAPELLRIGRGDPFSTNFGPLKGVIENEDFDNFRRNCEWPKSIYAYQPETEN